MNTSKMHKSALASAIALAMGISVLPQTSVADITLTFQNNATPSAVPLPFLVGTSATIAYPANTEFRVMTPYGTAPNDGFKDAIFGGETWTYDNAGELTATAGVATAGNPGTCIDTSLGLGVCSARLQRVAGTSGAGTVLMAPFPLCDTPADTNCPVLQQGANFLSGGQFNFLAPVKGSLAGDAYGAGTIAVDLTANSLVTSFPVTHAQWAEGSYIIGADDPSDVTHNEQFVKGFGPGVNISDTAVTVTSAPGAADITLDFILHGESQMTKDEVTVGGFRNQTVQWELPGTATIENQSPVATDDGSAGIPLSGGNSGDSIPVDVLANDSDPDHLLLNSTTFDTLVVNSVGACSNGGGLTNNGANVTYQSDIAFAGIETCTYTTGDGRTGVSTPATITMVVGAGDSPPTGVADGPGGAFQTNQGEVVSVDVLANDSDVPENDPFTVSRVDAVSASGGAVAIINAGAQGGNNVMYTPVSGFNGTDSFTYDVTDKDGTTANINVQIQVAPFTESSAGTVTVSNTINSTAIPVDDPDSSSSCQGGCFQVELTGVPAGGQVEILAPKRSTGYSQDAVFRHFVDSTQMWKDHEAPDTVQTAPEDGGTGLCPGLTSPLWRTPTAGDTCTKYTLTDNGPNDDNPVPGEIRDPVGFAQPIVVQAGQQTVISPSGCTLDNNANSTWRNAGHWLLLGGLFAFMRLFRRSNKQS